MYSPGGIIPARELAIEKWNPLTSNPQMEQILALAAPKLGEPTMKKCRLAVFTAMICLCALALAIVSPQSVAQNAAVLPAWMRPGIVVVYDTISAFVRNGRFEQGIQTVMTTKVNSISGGIVNGVTNVSTVGTGIGGTHQWACNAAGNCQTDASTLSGQFWIDINHPASSTRGANGEIYKVMGQAPYSNTRGQTWTAVTLSFQNPSTGGQLTTIYDAKTGLVLLHSEVSPAQQVHVYFRTITGW
jgi:hypothetical protein